MASLVIAGLEIAGAAYAGCFALQAAKTFNWAQVQKTLPSLPEFSLNAYCRGGFEPTMTKREAALILGVTPSAKLQRVRDAHRRIMIVNHSDKGGSPYIASKINEAKEFWKVKPKETDE